MATFYSSWFKRDNTNVCRTIIEVTVTSNTATAAAIQLVTKIQYGNLPMWPTELTTNLSIATSIGGSAASATGTVSYTRGGTQTLDTRSVTITKTHSTQSIAVSGTVTLTYRGSSQQVALAASGTQAVSAKASYAVTYHANGGDANTLPAAQVKWHGETLTISATVPKRAGCTFLGWNTNADGTGSKYAPSGSYAGNAKLDLHAIWLGASVPSIECERTDSTGTEADEGTYGTVAASWQAVGSPTASVTVIATNVTTGASITLTGDTSGSKAAQQELTGNVSALFGADEGQSGALDTDTRYAIRVTVTVSATGAYAGSSVTATSDAYIAFAYITMDFLSGGHGVAFGKTAVREGFDNAMEPNYAKVPAQHDTDLRTTTIASVITANTSVATVMGVDAKRWGKVAQIQVNFTNAAAISVPADGNIGDITIGTLAEGLRPAISTGGQSFGDNAGQAWYYINAAGSVNLCAVEGTGAARTIPAGTLFNCVATFILP